MAVATVRLRYTQFLIVCLLSISLYMTAQSLTGGLPQFENNLPGRRPLVSIFTNLKLMLGDRVYLQALVGKQGWLFYDQEVRDAQHETKIPLSELEKTQHGLQEFYKRLQEKNITLIVVIAPDKTTIYPDKLPDEIQKLNPESRLDTFTAYLQQHGPPVLVDLRPALREGRKQQDLYYKTDTHWNAVGALIGVNQILRYLSKTYPQMVTRNIKDYKIVIGKPSLHDIPKIMGASYLLESPIKLRLNKAIPGSSLPLNPDGKTLVGTPPSRDNLPALLMYLDSFGAGLKGYISPYFGKKTFIRSSSPNYANALSLESTELLKPDVVIIEIVERSFNVQVLRTLLNQILSGNK